MEVTTNQDITVIELIDKYNNELDQNTEATAIVLAAGHGKRIKSQRSKMLHKIWGKTTVERVSAAARRGLKDANLCIVVGIKADSVIKRVGKKPQQVYAFQEEQLGTGHAVQIALQSLPDYVANQNIFVFPGDIGLLRTSTVQSFGEKFTNTKADMMVLTGTYEGDPEENYYGRIVRVPAVDADGNPSSDAGKVIQIMEAKDIQALNPNKPYVVDFHGKKYEFTRQELMNINEFNTGVFAFKGNVLRKYLYELDVNNVQGELYVTDLIKIFNDHGLTVEAFPADDSKAVLGFNNKSVLREMNSIYQAEAYDKLKDIIKFRDPLDFFLSDEIVAKILAMDKSGEPLDIKIGKSVYIKGNIEFASGLTLADGVNIQGNVVFGKNVTINKGVEISTYPHQTLHIGENTQIFQDNIIKGNTHIGKNCRIESGVNVTGSDQYPTRIGNQVMIKGTSYIFGTEIEENSWIEHCVLKAKRVKCNYDREGNVVPIRYVIPYPEGLENVESIGDDREEYTWPK